MKKNKILLTLIFFILVFAQNINGMNITGEVKPCEKNKQVIKGRLVEDLCRKISGMVGTKTVGGEFCPYKLVTFEEFVEYFYSFIENFSFYNRNVPLFITIEMSPLPLLNGL